MGGDHKVNTPVIESSNHLSLLCCADAARKELQPKWIRGESTTEGFNVLEREDGGGDKECHLAPRLKRGECSAQRHLGLPVAHVAHNHAIHRSPLGKIRLRRLNRRELIGCLSEREGRLELNEPRGFAVNRWAVGEFARRIDAQQLVSEIIGGSLRALLGASPLTSAEPTECRIFSACIARDSRQLFRWHEDTITAAVLNLKVVALITLAAASSHAQEASESVINVHEQIARGETLGCLACNAAAVHRGATNARCAEEFTVCDDRQRIHTALEATIKSAVQQRDALRLRIAGERIAHGRCGTRLCQELRKSPRLFRNDHHPRPVASPTLKSLGKLPRATGGHQRIMPTERIARLTLGESSSFGAPRQFEALRTEAAEQLEAHRRRRDWRGP